MCLLDSHLFTYSAQNCYIFYHYSVLWRLTSRKMEPLSLGVIFTALLLVYKSLYRKIGDMLCSVLLDIWWYHMLESYCSNNLFISLNILSTFHIFTCIYCLYIRYYFWSQRFWESQLGVSLQFQLKTVRVLKIVSHQLWNSFMNSILNHSSETPYPGYLLSINL